MKNLAFYFSLICLLFGGCDFYQNDYHAQIQGDWVSEYDFSNKDERRMLFSFEDSIGSYSYPWGNFTHYQIVADTIFIKEKIRKRRTMPPTGGKRFFKYKIKKLTEKELHLLLADSLTKKYSEKGAALLKLYKTIPISNLKFTRIGFYSSGCYGTCPNMYLEFDSLGHFFFHGKNYTDSLGFYSGKISKTDLNLITKQIRVLDFENLKLKYHSGGSDSQFRTIFLKTNGKDYETFVYGFEQEIAEIEFLFQKIMEVYKNVDLKQDSSIINKFQFKNFKNRAESYVY